MLDESGKRGARVCDRDGNVWRRGWTIWHLVDVSDAVDEVTALPWAALVSWRGPLKPAPDPR
jgi:hypothetical protein